MSARSQPLLVDEFSQREPQLSLSKFHNSLVCNHLVSHHVSHHTRLGMFSMMNITRPRIQSPHFPLSHPHTHSSTHSAANPPAASTARIPNVVRMHNKKQRETRETMSWHGMLESNLSSVIANSNEQELEGNFVARREIFGIWKHSGNIMKRIRW